MIVKLYLIDSDIAKCTSTALIDVKTQVHAMSLCQIFAEQTCRRIYRVKNDFAYDF